MGKFKIQRLLVTGSHCWVFEALDTLVHQPVTLKIMHPSVARFHESSLWRFKREAVIARSVQHPNIIRVHDVTYEDGYNVMSMEFLPGFTLASLLESTGPLPEDVALRVTLDVTEALAALSKNGVVHRDIRPANIHVSQKIPAKLIDFGLARRLNDDGSPSVTRVFDGLGDLRYTAPEQIIDSTSVDERADIYSLGITLYQMLAGSVPFDGLSEESLSHKHFFKPPPPLPADISQATRQLVADMLQKQVQDRIPTCQNLLARLEAMRKG